jgi:hypothetical protein
MPWRPSRQRQGPAQQQQGRQQQQQHHQQQLLQAVHATQPLRRLVLPVLSRALQGPCRHCHLVQLTWLKLQASLCSQCRRSLQWQCNSSSSGSSSSSHSHCSCQTHCSSSSSSSSNTMAVST